MINKHLPVYNGKKLIRLMKKARKNKKKFLLGLIPAKIFKTFSIQFLVLLLLVGLNWSGILAIGTTAAYYNDTETASENGFTASSLDFSLTENSFQSTIGLDETVSKNTVIVNGDGMDFQYTLEVEEVSGESDFCDALNLQAKLNGVEQYNGSLMSLTTPVLTTLGTWKFNIELPVDEDSFINGEECQFDVVFKGWQTNVGAYGDGGFSDEERMSFTITAGKMIVLNEFLPNPDGVAYGFDFGSDSSDMPQGEWVELYNNSTESVDLTGWYLRDDTPGEGNKTDIVASNSLPATTIIGGKSWLVIYMNKPIYNNTGDTVRLFNGDNILVDSHTYDDPDFCEIEPTPGDDNSTDASGSCTTVPPNKSYARIPDGIGDWVDPIPTPGKVNMLLTEFGDYSYVASSVSFEDEIIVEGASVEEESVTPGEPNNISDETTGTGEEVTTDETADEPVEQEEIIEEEIAPNTEEEPLVIGSGEETIVQETIIEEG